MPIEIRLPELAESMTEGTLAVWHKREGDWVKPGDVLADIETDKSTVELEASEEGRLGRILVAEGTEEVAVGTVLALLLPPGEVSDSSEPAAEPLAPKESDSAAGALSSPAASPTGGVQADRGRQAPEPRATDPVEENPASAIRPPPEPRRSTPLARRMAEAAGLDLGTLVGTGAGERITKADVEAALGRTVQRAPSPLPDPSPEPAQPSSTAELPFHRVRASRMRRVIARRLSEAKRTIPHFYLQVDCDVQRLQETRRELNACLEREGRGDRLTVNDFVVRAAALALQQVPEANVSWDEESVRTFERVDVGIAVATEAGLVTPVVKDAPALSLLQLSRCQRALAERARAGRLSPEEYQGGTFTVSNLGMYGIDTLYPIINPPQSGILGAGAVVESVVARDGQAVVRGMMSCSLCCDHRVVDGAVGGRLLAAVRDALEDPLRIVL